MGQQRCKDCGEPFEYSEDFYIRRGFSKPKRCPGCAAKVRGREAHSKNRECLLKLQNVMLDIPENHVCQPVYLKRKDKGKKSMRHVHETERITCLRFYVRPIDVIDTRGYITVYDQRNNDPDKYKPLHGELARASVRVMRVERGRYDYLVLDSPVGNGCDGILTVVDSLVGAGDCKWHRYAESRGEGTGTFRWYFGIFALANNLGEKLCKVLQAE